MGQKVNPIGLRLGINRTWDSRWFSRKEYGNQLHDDLQAARVSRQAAGPGGGLANPDRAGRAADPDHAAFGPPRRHHRQEGRRHRQIARRHREDHEQRGQPQHRRDPQARDRGEADRRGHRAAARTPRRVPPRDEARGAVGDAVRRAGHPHQLLRPARRRRDRAHGVVSRGPRAIAHAARRRRFRLRHGEDHLRHLRRQGLGVQGRDPGARPDGAGQAVERAAGRRSRAAGAPRAGRPRRSAATRP